MSELFFNQKIHEYSISGVVYPSVTEILKASGLSDFSKVDPVVLKRSSDFGTAVHSAIHYYCKGTLDENSVDPEIKPYLQAWDNFEKDYEYVCHKTEVRGFSERYRFAWTIDQKGVFEKEGFRTGLVLLDIKTGRPKPADRIQMGGYRIGAGKEYRYIVLLYLNPSIKPTGYKVELTTNNKKEQGIFLAALSLYNFRKENNLL